MNKDEILTARGRIRLLEALARRVRTPLPNVTQDGFEYANKSITDSAVLDLLLGDQELASILTTPVEEEDYKVASLPRWAPQSVVDAQFAAMALGDTREA